MSVPELYLFATSFRRVFVTSHIADLARIHTEWIDTGEGHSGIILVQQQKWGPGELAQRIVRLLADRVDMRNRIEFLGNW